MKPSTIVDSLGSVWLFDEAELTYCRMPRVEGVRENGWGGPDQGPLEDLVWHPYVRWEIRAGWRLEYVTLGMTEVVESAELYIVVEDHGDGTGWVVTAPQAEVRR